MWRVEIFIVVLAEACVFVIGHPRNTDQHEYNRHLRRVNQFSCKHPQPKAIPVNDLFKNGIQPDESFQPANTVLHRCDNTTGCCHVEMYSCVATETEEVRLVFRVDHLVDSNARPTHYETVIAQNHTRCACRETNSLPK